MLIDIGHISHIGSTASRAEWDLKIYSVNLIDFKWLILNHFHQTPSWSIITSVAFLLIDIWFASQTLHGVYFYQAIQEHLILHYVIKWSCVTVNTVSLTYILTGQLEIVEFEDAWSDLYTHVYPTFMSIMNREHRKILSWFVQYSFQYNTTVHFKLKGAGQAGLGLPPICQHTRPLLSLLRMLLSIIKFEAFKPDVTHTCVLQAMCPDSLLWQAATSFDGEFWQTNTKPRLPSAF